MRPYEQLTDKERAYADEVMDDMRGFTVAGTPPLAGDDRQEKFADALATWIIESRPAADGKPKSFSNMLDDEIAKYNKRHG